LWCLPGCKRTTLIQDICGFIGFPASATPPTKIFIDSQPCIDILQSKVISPRVKHVTVPINFTSHQIFLHRVSIFKIGTHLNQSDSATKTNSSPVHIRNYDGERWSHRRPLLSDTLIKSPFHSPTDDLVPLITTMASTTQGHCSTVIFLKLLRLTSCQIVSDFLGSPRA